MNNEDKSRWDTYIQKTKDNPPRTWLVKALAYVTNKDDALDAGAGALIDTKYLLDQGFNHVVALDQTNLAQDIFDALPPGKAEYVISSYEDYQFPAETFDIINAQYALPFNPPLSFNRVFAKLVDSLKPGGIFVGQFFGDRDQWNVPEKNMTFHTEAEVRSLLADLEILEIEEEENDRPTALGEPKHWHIFHVIARKGKSS